MLKLYDNTKGEFPMTGFWVSLGACVFLEMAWLLVIRRWQPMCSSVEKTLDVKGQVWWTGSLTIGFVGLTAMIAFLPHVQLPIVIGIGGFLSLVMAGATALIAITGQT